MRYTGVAVAYNLGFAIIGGLTPVAATALIRWSGDSHMPAYLMILFVALGVAALAIVRLHPPENRAAAHR